MVFESGDRAARKSGDTMTVPIETPDSGCPCILAGPCGPGCSCASSGGTGGCHRCASYGSLMQRLEAARRLARIIDRGKSRRNFEVDVEIELVFEDWMRDGKSIYATEEGIGLSLGDLHSGTVFHGMIRLDADDEDTLIEAARTGAYATFRLLVRPEAGGSPR